MVTCNINILQAQAYTQIGIATIDQAFFSMLQQPERMLTGF